MLTEKLRDYVPIAVNLYPKSLEMNKLVKDMYGQKWNHPWKYYEQQYKMAPLDEIENSGVLGNRKPSIVNVVDGVGEKIGQYPDWGELTLAEKRIWVAWVGNHDYKSPPDS